jgi:hypothetical protein
MSSGFGRHTGAIAIVAASLMGPADGAFARDPGINQPGRAGNVGVGAPGVGVGAPGVGVVPGVGVGAPGVGVVDPGLNQPGVAGNVGGVARRSVRR